VRILKADVQSQQTQVELSHGLMRAEVVKFNKPYANFKIRTMTAAIGLDSSGAVIHALDNLTEIYCLQGVCSVQNVDAAIPGAVTLHAGESTTVPGGLPPTPSAPINSDQLQSQLDLTEVGPPTVVAGSPGNPATTTKQPWHIGSLSPGSSVLLLVGVGGGVGAAAAVAASGGHSSGSTPSPSAP
jgi:hypothetical protein